MHTDCEVLALDIAGRDMGNVGIALAADFLDPGAFGGAVAPRRSDRRALELHELGEVHVVAETALNRFKVGTMAVRRKLHAIGETVAQIVHKHHGALARTVADMVAHDQLGIGINRGPRPHVASAFRGCSRARHVLLLGVAERPGFIALNAARLHVANRLTDAGNESAVAAAIGHIAGRGPCGLLGCEVKVARPKVGKPTEPVPISDFESAASAFDKPTFPQSP